ncbi:MAG: SoxR reducing system RseC family protein [Firmicutes bacterium]|nr:SoxR reducing system RseC family protein [Bacillota bacterium]
MKERGKVIDISGDTAKVEIIRRDECSRCKVCGFGSRDTITVIADNAVKAEKQDEVELELKGSQVLKAAAIMYLIPLAFFLIGLHLGNIFTSYIDRQDMMSFWSAVFGFVFLGLSYVGISIYSRRSAISKYRAKITRILIPYKSGRGENE